MHWREMVHRSEHSYKHTISFWSQMQCYTISRVYQWLEKHHVWSPLASEDVTHTVVMVILWIYNRTIRQVCNNFLPPSPRADFLKFAVLDLSMLNCVPSWFNWCSITSTVSNAPKYKCNQALLFKIFVPLAFASKKNLLFTCCKSLFKGYIYYLNI